MGSLATILVLTGTPFWAGAGLASVPMPRLARVILAASLPVVLITWYRGTDHGLADTVTLAGLRCGKVHPSRRVPSRGR